MEYCSGLSIKILQFILLLYEQPLPISVPLPLCQNKSELVCSSGINHPEILFSVMRVAITATLLRSEEEDLGCEELSDMDQHGELQVDKIMAVCVGAT